MADKKITIGNFLTPPSTELGMFVQSDNQLEIANGVNLSYKLGAIIKDLGYSKVGTTLEAGKSITGLFHFRQSSSIDKILATVNNSAGTNLTLQYNNAGTWTDIVLTNAWDTFEDAEVDMESYIGYCFFVGYDSTDKVFLPVGSLTGTTFSVATNVTSMPQAKYIKRYRDRLYIANCYSSATAHPYRVYYSSIPAGGAITWTPASDFIDVDFAEAITGIEANWDRLMIFTEFSAYSYDQTSKKKVWEVGCGNYKTLKNYSTYMIWANKDNVWTSTGGQPSPIGDNILELIRQASPSNWKAEVIDDEYYLYLGATEANGISYSNCCAIYSFRTGMWRWREYYDNFTTFAKYTSGGDDYLYMGANDGMVMTQSKWTDATPIFQDDGNPILAHFRTNKMAFGDPDVQKNIESVTAYCKYAQGMSLRYRVVNKNDENLMPFQEIGTLETYINDFDGIGLQGNFIQFEGKEYGDNKPFEFYGLTINYDLLNE